MFDFEILRGKLSCARPELIPPSHAQRLNAEFFCAAVDSSWHAKPLRDSHDSTFSQKWTRPYSASPWLDSIFFSPISFNLKWHRFRFFLNLFFIHVGYSINNSVAFLTSKIWSPTLSPEELIASLSGWISDTKIPIALPPAMLNPSELGLLVKNT